MTSSLSIDYHEGRTRSGTGKAVFENSNGSDLAKSQYQSNSLPIDHGWAEAVKSCRAEHRVLNFQTFSRGNLRAIRSWYCLPEFEMQPRAVHRAIR
jgi:hypothetical protein